MTEQPKTAAGRARNALVTVIKQLRANDYRDWPDWLERDVLPVIEAEAAAPAEACICTVPGYMPGVDCKYPHLATQPAPAPRILGAAMTPDRPERAALRDFIETVAATSNDPHLAQEAQRILNRLNDPERAALAEQPSGALREALLNLLAWAPSLTSPGYRKAAAEARAALAAANYRLVPAAASGIDVRQLQAALHSTLPNDTEPHVPGDEPLCEYMALYLSESLKDPEIRAMHEARLAEADAARLSAEAPDD